MEDSIFTKIIKGDIPCYKLYEDDDVIAFLDVHPLRPGHTLVVPKVQIDHVWELDDALYHHVWTVAKQLSGRLQVTLQPVRVGVIVEGFGVPHAHVHLIPIDHADDLKQPQDVSGDIDHAALAAMAETLTR